MRQWGKLETLEEDLAVSKGHLTELTHFRQIVLAEQTQAALHEGAKSNAAAEVVARNSEAYRDVVLALAEATTVESRLWFRYRRKAREAGL